MRQVGFWCTEANPSPKRTHIKQRPMERATRALPSPCVLLPLIRESGPSTPRVGSYSHRRVTHTVSSVCRVFLTHGTSAELRVCLVFVHRHDHRLVLRRVTSAGWSWRWSTTPAISPSVVSRPRVLPVLWVLGFALPAVVNLRSAVFL